MPSSRARAATAGSSRPRCQSPPGAARRHHRDQGAVVLNAEPSRHLAAFSRHTNATSLGSPLRILHVFRAPVGGLFRHVVDVARAQIARGLDVGIFCDSSTGGARAAEALEELRPGLTLGVTRIPMWRNPHPFDLAALVALTNLCRARRP